MRMVDTINFSSTVELYDQLPISQLSSVLIMTINNELCSMSQDAVFHIKEHVR